MFTSAAVLASVLVSVLIIASLFLKTFGPAQPVPTRGIIPSGLAWEGLFQFLSSHLGTGARFLAECRSPANNPHEDKRADCAAGGLRDIAVCFRPVGLSSQRAVHRARRGLYLPVVPRSGRLPCIVVQPCQPRFIHDPGEAFCVGAWRQGVHAPRAQSFWRRGVSHGHVFPLRKAFWRRLIVAAFDLHAVFEAADS